MASGMKLCNYQEPQDKRPYSKAVWHYARAMAFIAKNNLTEAEKEIAELEKFANIIKQLKNFLIWGINSAGNLIKIAYEVAKGELDAKRKNYSDAIAHLNKSS
ncbi:MAG: hypothetical protein MZV64_56825 [Ignavibacteriales bacterium]|nr:hypothetical protein [Ignavibacteriales bacterium]